MESLAAALVYIPKYESTMDEAQRKQFYVDLFNEIDSGLDGYLDHDQFIEFNIARWIAIRYSFVEKEKGMTERKLRDYKYTITKMVKKDEYLKQEKKDMLI